MREHKNPNSTKHSAGSQQSIAIALKKLPFENVCVFEKKEFVKRSVEDILKDVHKDAVTLETEGNRPSVVAELGEMQHKRFMEIQN